MRKKTTLIASAVGVALMAVGGFAPQAAADPIECVEICLDDYRLDVRSCLDDASVCVTSLFDLTPIDECVDELVDCLVAARDARRDCLDDCVDCSRSCNDIFWEEVGAPDCDLRCKIDAYWDYRRCRRTCDDD
jgi:hypothetical protein